MLAQLPQTFYMVAQLHGNSITQKIPGCPGRNCKASYELASIVLECYLHPTLLAKQITQAGPG